MKNSLVNYELGQRIATLACENKSKTVKLKSLKPSDLELIKTTANGKLRMYMPGFTQTVVEE